MQSADKLQREMKEVGLSADAHTFTAAFKACYASKDWQRALNIFLEMEAQHPKLVTVSMWNELLAVLLNGGKPELLVAKVAEMAKCGLKLNTLTYSRLLGAHAALGDRTKVDSVISEMQAAGVEVTPRCRSNIVDAYATRGELQLAEETLEAAVKEGAVQPHMIKHMVRGCMRQGDVPRAQRWLQRSLSLGLNPPEATWHMAIDSAHTGGDINAVDALWRDAEAAGALNLYRSIWYSSDNVQTLHLNLD
ncbi:hypothetical protein JKP88DRAFT_333146, partial [Tribonema minus]